MSQIKLLHSGGNGVSIVAPDSNPASDRTLKLPSDGDGTILTTNSSTGKILQVVEAVKTDTASVANSASSYYESISGLQPQITPSATSSKILVMINLKLGISNATGDTSIKLFRSVGGSETEIFSGAAAGSRQVCIWGQEDFSSAVEVVPLSSQYLDTPSTTSQITYILKWQSQSQAAFVNRSGTDGDSAGYHRMSSSVTVMEVAA